MKRGHSLAAVIETQWLPKDLGFHNHNSASVVESLVLGFHKVRLISSDTMAYVEAWENIRRKLCGVSMKEGRGPHQGKIQ
jgi:hypothetical protein